MFLARQRTRTAERGRERPQSVPRYIEPDDLPARILSSRAGPRASHDDFEAARRQFEREYLEGLLKRCSGNVSRAAQVSGMHRTTLQRLLRRNDLRSEDFRA